MVPMIVAAAIGAAAAAAQGIAGAAQSKANADFQAQQASADRTLKEKLVKRQLAEQQRQFAMQQGLAAQQQLEGTLQQGSALQTQQATERAATREDMRQQLARAYLGG